MGNVTTSNQNTITSPNGNSLAIFVDSISGIMKVKDVLGNVQPLSDFIDRIRFKNILPELDNVYVLGNSEFRWKSLTLGTGTLFLLDKTTGIEAELTVDNGVLLVNGVSLLGTQGITFLGDGSIQTTAYIPAEAQSYNPLFTDVSGTLAGVTAIGSYTMLSPKICFFRVRVNFDSCTNFGTLQYQFNLPFDSAEVIRSGNGTLHQQTGNSLYHIAGIVDIDYGLPNLMKLYYSGSTTDLAWKYNTPVGATTVTSHFDISGTYQIS